jgi:hypothetical protein
MIVNKEEVLMVHYHHIPKIQVLLKIKKIKIFRIKLKNLSRIMILIKIYKKKLEKD